MKRFALACLLTVGLAGGAGAELVKFADGRVCNPCSVSRNNQGFITAVYDMRGNNWLTSDSVITETVAHPIWKWWMAQNANRPPQVYYPPNPIPNTSLPAFSSGFSQVQYSSSPSYQPNNLPFSQPAFQSVPTPHQPVFCQYVVNGVSCE